MKKKKKKKKFHENEKFNKRWHESKKEHEERKNKWIVKMKKIQCMFSGEMNYIHINHASLCIKRPCKQLLMLSTVYRIKQQLQLK